METKQDRTLCKKITRIMEELGQVKQTCEVSIRQGASKYRAFKEADLLGPTQLAFVKHGVVLLPRVTSCEIKGELFVVLLQADIEDCDSGEVRTIAATGSASARDERAAAKAQTDAAKSLIRKLLLISADDDAGPGPRAGRTRKSGAVVPDHDRISRQQQVRLFAALNQSAKTKDQLREYLEERGIASTGDLDAEQYESTMRWVEQQARTTQQ